MKLKCGSSGRKLLLAAASLLAVSSWAEVEARATLTAERVLELYQLSLSRNKAALQSSGRNFASCFPVENLDRSGLFKPGEWVHVLTTRFTLYGPGINATTKAALIADFEFIMKTIIYHQTMVNVGNVSIVAESDFSDAVKGELCTFNCAVFRTIILNMEVFASSDSKCLIFTSPSARNVSATVYSDVLRDSGYPGVYMGNFLYNGVYHPHPTLRLHRFAIMPLHDEDLRVELQLFGPCVLPFGLEKQTLLRLALHEVMTAEINIYDSQVKLVKEAPGTHVDGTEDSVTVTLTLSVYLDIHLRPFLEVFRQATTWCTDVEGCVPPLNTYLAAAGLATTSILVHEAEVLKDGPGDTVKSSVRRSLEILEGLETRDRHRLRNHQALKFWGMSLGLLFGAVLLIVCAISRRRYRVSGLQRMHVAEVLGMEGEDAVLAELSSASATALTTSPMESWSQVLLHPGDIAFSKDTFGRLLRVGKGATSQVYKGRLRGSGVDVAIKVLPVRGESAQESFLKEVAVLQSCSGRYTVQFLGVTLLPSHILLVMEFMDAGDLHHAIHDSPNLRWSLRGARVAHDIAAALEDLHANSIIHLDLKPSNVLLSREGNAKLADVGLATWLTTMKSHQTITGFAGTLAYMAPEMLLSGIASNSADIYSFGVVLWELVTGEAAQRGRSRPCRVPEECPKWVADLISKCCSPDRESRPSAAEIAQLLFEQIEVLARRAALDLLEDFHVAVPDGDAGLANNRTPEGLPSSIGFSSSNLSSYGDASSTMCQQNANDQGRVRNRKHVAQAMLKSLQNMWNQQESLQA